MAWNNESKVNQRLRLVQSMVRKEKSVTELCREAGVSRQTGYKFLARYEALGRAGLEDHTRANRASEWLQPWRRRVLALRRCWPTWGGAKLRHGLRRRWPGRRVPSQRTIERWLRQAGLSRQRSRRRRGHKMTVKCRVARSCNHVWTADLKGWFRTQDGRRIEPLTVRDLHSRYLLAVTAASTCERDIRRIFTGLFRQYGLPKIIRTDHGLPFCGVGPHRLTKLSLWWHRLGIKVQFVRRHEGIHNNAHEQMHRVLQQEVAAQPAPNYRGQCRALEAWRQSYNHQRGHAALKMRTPAECYHASNRLLPRLRRVVYPSAWLVRRVHHGGEIMLEGQRFSIGRAFARQPVALRLRRNGTYEVYFDRLKLGILDPLCRNPAALDYSSPNRRGG
jgi:putative transposase